MKRVTSYKLHILLFIFCFLILTSFKIDPDLGWHLRLGRDFLDSGQIVGGDQFSWTMPGYFWANSYLAYDVFVSWLFRVVGFLPTAMFFGFVAAMAFFILLPKRLDVWKLAVVGLGAAIAVANVGIRPHTVSLLFFSMVLVFLERNLWQRKFFWVWFLLFALWANFHRGFVVGLVFLGLFLVLELFSKTYQKKKVFLGDLLATCTFAVLGTFATPFFASTWKSAILFDLMSRENLNNIAEWQPLALYTPVNLLLALSGMVFLFVFYRKIRSIRPSWFLLAALFFMLSFVFTLLVFFWAAIFVFLVSRNLDFQLRWKGDHWLKFSLAAIFIAVMLAFLLNFAVGVIDSLSINKRILRDAYPVGALNFMENAGLVDNIFNEYRWGGFILWQYPNIKVFVDGRMASWKTKSGESILGDYVSFIRGNCKILGKYRIKTALVSRDFTYECLDRWQETYKDEISRVLVNPDFK